MSVLYDRLIFIGHRYKTQEMPSKLHGNKLFYRAEKYC